MTLVSQEYEAFHSSSVDTHHDVDIGSGGLIYSRAPRIAPALIFSSPDQSPVSLLLDRRPVWQFKVVALQHFHRSRPVRQRGDSRWPRMRRASSYIAMHALRVGMVGIEQQSQKLLKSHQVVTRSLTFGSSGTVVTACSFCAVPEEWSYGYGDCCGTPQRPKVRCQVVGIAGFDGETRSDLVERPGTR